MSASVAARRSTIEEMVQAEGYVSIVELARRLDVSEMSIRRDATALAGARNVVRVPGGLVAAGEGRVIALPTPQDDPAPFVAGVARDLQDTEVIMIDAGRTALSLARHLPSRFRGTVITHSLPVMELLTERPEITTIGLGGELYCRSKAFIGSSALSALERLQASTFFMGAASVGPEGFFATRDVERAMKRAMIRGSKRVVLLAGHEKFSAAAPVFIGSWDERFTVVTDGPVPPAVVAALDASGANLRVVKDS